MKLARATTMLFEVSVIRFTKQIYDLMIRGRNCCEKGITTESRRAAYEPFAGNITVGAKEGRSNKFWNIAY